MPSPIAHCLMGCSLYADRSADRRRNWWALAAMVFFANAPDLDFMPGAWAGHPLMVHRMATHSLLAPFFMALLAGFIFIWRSRDEALGAARLVFFAVLSHIVLDFFCASTPAEGPMLFWPFSPLRFASSPSIFPVLSHQPILSWGNVVALIGEAAIVSCFLLLAVVWRSLKGVKPARRTVPSFPLLGAGD